MKFLSLILILFSTNSFAAVGLSVLGLADISQISSSGFNTGSQTTFGGGGLILVFPLTEDWTIETGAQTFERQWSDNTNGSNTIQADYFEVPVIFHYHFNPYFSAGIGAYYTTNVGSLNETGAVNNSNLSYATYGIKNNEYGMVGDLGAQFPITPEFWFQAHGRYLYGIPEESTVSGSSFKYRDLQILAGFTFIFGK